MTTGEPAHIETQVLDLEVARRAVESGADVVVLPIGRRDDKAVYSDSSIDIAKVLRGAGLQLAFLDPDDQRIYEVKKGATTDIVIAFAVNLASSGAWDAIKAVLAATRPRLSVSYSSFSSHDSDVTGQTWRVEGDSAAVIEALERLLAAESDKPERP